MWFLAIRIRTLYCSKYVFHNRNYIFSNVPKIRINKYLEEFIYCVLACFVYKSCFQDYLRVLILFLCSIVSIAVKFICSVIR